MTTIILISTHWNYSNGGINSFNYDFALSLGNLAKNKGIRVVCLCYVDPKLQQVKEARENNIDVISLNKKSIEIEFQHDLQLIHNKLSEININGFVYFVGHDIFTGDLSNYLKSQYPSNSASLVFHHMDYESYYAIKGGSSPSDLAKKFSKQTSILQDADLVFGVGPKLYKSALNKTSKNVEQIIPGIQEIQKWERNIEKLKMVMFGRYDVRTDRLKQMGLGVESFSYYMNQFTNVGYDATFQIVGINTPEEATLLSSHTSSSKKYLNILPLPYTEDRQSLFDTLRKSNVCLMLSYHEGFGLAGYEAIGASVPLILSQNSGLYMFLSEYLQRDDLTEYGIYALEIDSSIDGKVNLRDKKKVAQAIHAIYTDNLKYRNNISFLKDLLKSKFRWENSTQEFLDKIEAIKIASNNFEPAVIEVKKTSNKVVDYEEILNKTLNKKAISLPVNQLCYIDRKTYDEKVLEKIKEGNRVYLVGDHGIGKSSIAKNYVKECYAHYKHILWINYQTNIQQSLIISVLGKQNILIEQFQKDIDSLYSEILQSMNDMQGEKLLIIDNFDDVEGIKSFVGEFTLYDWKVLITTTKNINIIPESQKIAVNTMSYPEGFELFESITGKEKHKLYYEDFEKIFKQEELSPFLIEFFAYSLKRNVFTNTKSNTEIPSQEKVLTPYRYFSSQLSLDDFLVERFKSESGSFSRNQLLFLYIYSLFPNNYNDRDIINEILGLTFSHNEIQTFMNIFIEMGWISSARQVHYLRQKIVLELVEPDKESISKVLEYITIRLDIVSGTNPLLKLKFLPIAYSLMEKLPSSHEVSRLVHKVGILEFDFGNLDKSLQLQTSIVDKVSEIQLLGDILFDIGLIEERIGNYTSSIDYLKKAVNHRGDKTMKKLNTLSKISVVYGKLNTANPSEEMKELAIAYYNKSASLLEQLIEIEVVEANDPDVGTIYVDSAAVLGEFDDYQEVANQLFVKGINIYESKLSKLHPWLATTYNLYGNYLIPHDIKLALSFIELSLTIREEIYTDNKNHYSLAESYHDLSYALFVSGDIFKAKEHIKKAIYIRQIVFKSNDDKVHPRLKSSMNLLDSINIKINLD